MAYMGSGAEDYRKAAILRQLKGKERHIVSFLGSARVENRYM
jgi:hypothetical protein